MALLLAMFVLSPVLANSVNVRAASPIVFDAKSSATPCMALPLGCSTLSWSHTVGPGSNGILVVSVEVGVASGHTLHTVDSIQYGTSPLTFIGRHIAFSNFDELEMWSLLKPASGTATITVTIAAVDGIGGGAVSYSNVGGLVDFEGDTGTHSSPSTTVKHPVSGNLVVDTVYGSVSDTDPPVKTLSVSPGSMQTERWNLGAFISHGDGTGEDVFMGGSDQSASSPVTMTWSSTPEFDYWLLDAVALAPPTPTMDIAVVRGTDNGVYWSAYNSPGVWSSWGSLAGATPSPPGICEASFGFVFVVVRGTDNGIYVKSWRSGTGWSTGWDSPGGATIDQPACAYLYGVLLIVVRGVGGELYFNSNDNGDWSGWEDLHGASASAPVLVSTPFLSRVDLVVQGTDNGIYHKAFTGGAWSSSWDSPGGAAANKPAVALYTKVTGCPSACTEQDFLVLVVRGTDNGVYTNLLSTKTSGWVGWSSLSGATLSAPTLAYDANSCLPGSSSDCSSIDVLAVRGTDNAVYDKTITGSWVWSGSWDSPGGSISNSPALAYVPATSAQFLLLVEGYPSSNLYSNTVAYPSTWGAYSSVSGATNSDPALAAVL